MSEKTGWLFSVGRIFSGSKDREQNGRSRNSSPKATVNSPKADKAANFLKNIITLEGESTSHSPSEVRRNATLRYLSPTAVDKSIKKTITNGVTASDDIFNSPISTKRKRQVTDADALFLGSTIGNVAKRSKSVANRSLLEPPSSHTAQGILSKLDTTWTGGMSISHSPASSVTSFSLLSKQSVPRSNGSDLSTSTMRILKHLEKVQTPAKEVQRIPMIRTAQRTEKWSEAPPLKKAVDATPSRIQLLSKTMALSAHRKPYWRDLTRKRGGKTTADGGETSNNGTSDMFHSSNDASVLSELFKPAEPEKMAASVVGKKQHQSILKGSDGKSVNTFKAPDLDEFEPASDLWLSKAKPLAPVEGKSVAPDIGFLSTLSFSFKPPAQLTMKEVKEAPTKKVESESEDSGSDTSEDEKESASSDEAEKSGQSEAEETDKVAKKSDVSRPQTSTDTVSEGATPESSKNSSPAEAAKAPSASWSCPECFTSWGEDKQQCGCCGYDKSGKPAAKQLVSSIDLSVKPTTNVKFGFGTGSTTSTAPTPSLFGFSKPKTSSPTQVAPTTIAKIEEKKEQVPIVKVDAPKEPSTTWSCPDCMVPNKESDDKCVCCGHQHKVAAQTSSARVDWACPDCMVQNKAVDSKCVCCGHEMYKTSAPSAQPSSVFGNRAFKPTTAAAPEGVSFGFGAKPASTAAPVAKFGFGTPVSEKKEPAKPATSLFAKPVEQSEEKKIDPPVATTAAAPAAALFNTGSLFGGSVTKTVETTAAPALSTIAPTPALSTIAPAPALSTTAPAPALSTVAPAPAASIFGSTPLFGASTTPAQAPVTAATDSTKTQSIFGSTPLFGASQTITSTPSGPAAASITPAPAPFVFGASSVTATAAPAKTTNFFGNADSGSAAPLFGSNFAPKPTAPATGATFSFGAPSATTGGIFGAQPAVTSAAPIGSVFGSQPATTTVAPTAGLFGAQPAATTGSIFGAKPTTGTATPSGSIFGSQPTTTLSAASVGGIFGAQPAAAASSAQPTLPAFGSFNTNLGSSNAFNFGSANNTAGTSNDVFKFGSQPAPSMASSSSTPAFQFGQTPAPAPTLSNSSSTNSMFSLAQPPKDFSFGSAPLGDATSTFQFSGASGSLFNPGPSAVPGLRPTTGRKMAVARRRRQ